MSISKEAGDARGLNGGAAIGAGAAPEADARDPALAPKLAEFRQHLQNSFAMVVITMMTTPRYKHCSIGELEGLVLDPLLRGRVAIAQARAKDGAAPASDDSSFFDQDAF